MDDTWNEVGEDDDLYMMQTGSMEEEEELHILPDTNPPPTTVPKDSKPSPLVEPLFSIRGSSAKPLPAEDDDGAVRSSAVVWPTLEELQSANIDSVSRQCSQLRDNSAFLIGSVASARVLLPSDADLGDAPVSFRVLFIEGGSQPIMFRCKTPVFSSTSVLGLRNSLQWPDSTFRFDMGFPDGTISGDILISLYQARSSGGNDHLGQVAFNLQQLCKTGSVEFAERGVEGRSLIGKFSLTTPDGNRKTGEIEMHLCLLTRDSDKKVPMKSLPSTMQQPRPRSGLASKLLESRQLPGQSAGTGAGTAAPSTARPRSASASGTRRPASAAPSGSKNASPPRKIVSKFMLKQQKEMRRISQENKKLQQVLQQHAGKANTKAGLAYHAGAEAGTKCLMVPSVAEAKSVASREPEDKEAKTILKLRALHDQLKRSNADLEGDIASLRAKISNVSIQSQKARGGIERGKASATMAATKASLSQVTIAHPPEEVHDLEYKQIKEEYDVLQSIRRGLLDRILRAKQAATLAGKAQELVVQEQELIRERVLTLRDEFRSFFLPGRADGGVAGSDSGSLLYNQLMILTGDLRELQMLRFYDCGDELQAASAHVELQATLSIVQGKIRELHDELQILRRESSAQAESLQNQLGAKELLKRREFLMRLKAMEMRLASEQRRSSLTQAAKRNEIALARIRMMEKERVGALTE